MRDDDGAERFCRGETREGEKEGKDSGKKKMGGNR